MVDFVGTAEEARTVLGQSPVKVRCYSTLEEYEACLMGKPFNFQRFSYSIRLGKPFRGQLVNRPKETRCFSILKDLQDRKTLLDLCLHTHQELSQICTVEQFPPLGLQECVNAGLFQWLYTNSFIAYLLEDLSENGYLDRDFQDWLAPGLKPLIWFEKEVQNRNGAWESLLEVRPKNREFPGSFKSFKPGFFFLFVETGFFEFVAMDQVFFTDLEKMSDWWLEALQGEPISKDLMVSWIKAFDQNYLQAFVLSCLKSIFRHSLQNYSWIRFMELVFEIFSEERILVEFFENSGAQMPVKEDSSFIYFLNLRWAKKLNSLRQFQEQIRSDS